MLYRRMSVVVAIAGILGLSGCVPIPSSVSVRSDGVMAMPDGLIYDPNVGKVLTLEIEENETIRGMEWSPDGKRLLVAVWKREKPKPEEVRPRPPGGPRVLRMPQPGKTELWLCDENGGNRKLLMEGPGMIMMGHWRPDGKMVTVIFVGSGGALDLAGVDVETGKLEMLAERVPPYHAWEPGGKRLAFFTLNGDDGGGPLLPVMTLVTMEPGQPMEPHAAIVTAGWPWVSWSRDGKRILFCAPVVQLKMPLSRKSGDEKLKEQLSQSALFSLTVDTGEMKRLTKRKIIYAVESPDGKHILFVELAGKGKTKVGVMNPDGTGTRVLDEGVLVNEEELAQEAVIVQPVWLSNTRVLYYKGEIGDFTNIPHLENMFAIDIDGKNREALGAKIRKLLEAR